MTIKLEDVARRKTMRAEIEAVLCDPVTMDFGHELKAVQITLAIEPQIVDLIAATRTAALEEAAVIAESFGYSGYAASVAIRAAKAADS